MKQNTARGLSYCGSMAAALMMGSCGALDPAVAMVKGGTLQSCPNATVEQMVNGFMGNPSWESDVAGNSVKFVNIGGDMTIFEKPVRATVQFVVDEEAGSFEYQAFELNGVPQNNLMAASLMAKMCESADTSSSERSSSVSARSQVTDALKSATGVKAAVAEAYAMLGTFPATNEESGLSEALQTPYANVEVVAGGVVKVAFNDQADSSLRGAAVMLVPGVSAEDDVYWSCTGSGVPRENLPEACR
jgi:hypothetical protein